MTNIKEIGKAAGFDKVIVANWDWSIKRQIILDTIKLSGGLGLNGILVVPFVAVGPETGRVACIQVVGFPGNHSTTAKRTMSISKTPCRLYEPDAFRTGATATLWHCLGTPKYPAIILTPGVTYYLNVAMRSKVTANAPYGVQSFIPSNSNYPRCEMRVTANRPDY